MAKAARGGRNGSRKFHSLAKLKKVRTTVGELIAAAFDNGVDIIQLLSSRELSRAAHARIVLQ